jgi:hypothetical protein
VQSTGNRATKLCKCVVTLREVLTLSELPVPLMANMVVNGGEKVYPIRCQAPRGMNVSTATTANATKNKTQKNLRKGMPPRKCCETNGIVAKLSGKFTFEERSSEARLLGVWRMRGAGE